MELRTRYSSLTYGGEFRFERQPFVKLVQDVLRKVLLHEIVDLFPRIRLQNLIHVENTVDRGKGKRSSSKNLPATHLEGKTRSEKGPFRSNCEDFAWNWTAS